jgi:hypothetical protein
MKGYCTGKKSDGAQKQKAGCKRQPGQAVVYFCILNSDFGFARNLRASFSILNPRGSQEPVRQVERPALEIGLRLKPLS